MATDFDSLEKLGLKEARLQNLKFYWTGGPCKNGHIAFRSVAGRCCCACRKEQSAADFLARPEYYAAKSKRWYADKERSRKKTAAWRARNIDRDRENRRGYAKNNKERLKAQRSAWAKRNPEKVREKYRKWYEKNQKRQQERGRVNRARNLERYREYSREYNRNNRPLVAVLARNRRARQRQNGGKHTVGDVQELFVLQKGRCAYCKTKLGDKYHVDHIQPLMRGGSNGRENLQLLCAPCNQSKSAKDPIEFMQERGMLL